MKNYLTLVQITSQQHTSTKQNLYSHLTLTLFVVISLLWHIGYVYTTAHAANSSAPKNMVPGQINGTVFNDYNANGSDDGEGEGGIDGILVTAYDAVGNTFTATTGADGTYTLSGLTDGTEYRIEFTRPAALSLLEPGAAGGSTVQFVTAPTDSVNVGFNYPAHYCQNNPTLVTNCYVHGAQNTITDDVMVSFPYNAGCQDSNLDGICDNGSFSNPTPTHVANANQMGTTWGLAYQRSTDTLFAGAFMKRHTGFRQNGATGSIYKIENASSVSPTITEYVDLDALGTDTGTDPHPADNAALLDWERDSNSWDWVGKMSLGDMDISDDEQTLWTVNLFDRKLYRIPIQSTALQAGDLDSYDITNPCGNSTDFRPFAVAFHEGIVYVGVTCTAESTVPGSHTASQVTNHVGDRAQLSATIYSFDPQSSGFAQELTFPLNYSRAMAINSSTLPSDGEWNPWVPVFTAYNRNTSGCAYDRAYPQPWLTDIEFDNGNMILGIRDRFGDQTGYNMRAPSGVNVNGVGTGCSPQGYFNGTGVGDTLRVCGNPTNGWTLESNGSCGGTPTGGMGNGDGPNGGEYYYQDDYHFTLGSFTQFHNDVGLGGIVQIPGALEVAITAMDPINDPDEFYNGGVLWLDNNDGTRPRSYEVFDTAPNFGQPGDGTLAKANGLGDLEAFCLVAPIEIGNRVWNDTDGDGIQDPGEAGISGVMITLHTSNGTQLASATTDSEGHYYFSSGPGTNTAHAIYNISGLSADTASFELRIGTAQTPLVGLSLSPQDNDANDDPEDGDLRDSDADLSGAIATVSFDTGPMGANNHAYDYGFTTIVAEQVAIGNFIWNDLDNDGIFDSGNGESGIDGIEVQLFQGTIVTGSPFLTTTTTGGGFYLFDNLDEGDYVVHIPATEFAENAPLDGYISSGPEGGDNSSDDDTDENGQNTLDSGGIRSTSINLLADNEPISETGQGSYSGTLDDNHVNMTVDFGFYRLSLGNLVFNDVYNNGTFDPLENDSGLDGVVVNLHQGTTVGATPFMTTTTSGGGFYLFDGLQEGDYVVELAQSNWEPGGVLAKFLSSLTNPITLADSAPDPDDDVNDDDNGIQQMGLPRSVVSQPVTLSAPQEPVNDGDNDANSNLSVDFGLYDPDIGDLVFCDANGNGMFDANSSDYGIPGVLLNLYVDSNTNGVLDATDALTRTTTTTTTGEYVFAFMPPNEYIVEVDPSNFGAGQVLEGAISILGAPDPDNDINNDDNGDPLPGFGIVALPLTLTSGGEPTNDGDNSEFTNLSVDFGFLQCNGAPTVEVSKQLNSMNPFTVGEAISFTIRITNTSNVTITTLPLTDTYNMAYLTFDSVLDASSPNPASDATDDGNISWVNVIDFDADDQLVPNETLDLMVTFIAKAETSGAIADQCASADNTYNKVSALGVESCVEVSIEPPEPKLTLGDIIWHDINNNGIQEANEPGIDGVVVNLYEVTGSGNTFVLSTTTTTTNTVSGFYHFNVEEGKDYQVEVDVSNFVQGGSLEGFVIANNQPNISGTTVATQTELGLITNVDTLDFGYYCRFDLALDKKLATGQPATIQPNENVTFTITIYNQGTVTATNVVIADYIPSGFTLNDSSWNGTPTGTVTHTLATSLAPSGTVGSSATVDIVLTAGAALSGTYTNTAEITVAESLSKDLDGNNYPDADSDPDSNDNESPVKDDVIDEDGKNVAGQDEDDHDLATVTVAPTPSNPAIALSKRLNGVNPFMVGEIISFTIRITNTGNVTITTLPLEDRYSTAFITYLNANPPPTTPTNGILIWNDLLASLNDTDGLGPGESVGVDVFFTTAADTTLLSAVMPCTESGHAPNIARSIGAVGSGITVVEDADDTACDSVQILNPTKVTLAEQSISQTAQGVLVRWATVSESDIVGFYIWRLNGVETTLQSDEMILAQKVGQSSGAIYEWLDAGATLQYGDAYVLEIVKRDGSTERSVIDVMSGGEIFLPLLMR